MGLLARREQHVSGGGGGEGTGGVGVLLQIREFPDHATFKEKDLLPTGSEQHEVLQFGIS